MHINTPQIAKNETATPLQQTLNWWAARDDMGGFKTAGRELFPHWAPNHGCCLPPHREDRLPSFSIRSNKGGVWYFKDGSTEQVGSLAAFVMLAGMDTDAANRWLAQRHAAESGAQAGDGVTSLTSSTTSTASGEVGSCNSLNSFTSSPSPGGVTSFNSLISLPVSDEYPQPMDAAAFHGVAGEIVRLIEPHTEADPVALLFQLLAAFGNIIGRDSHMVADGARHCLNLFGVLVGQSSKGRKGTSWNQIAALLERIDDVWKNDRVTSGLSSGEGLIWNVRDISTVTKADNEAAEGYREVVSDSGITDKRLLVVEGEFANTLKVMERETNTLSPVIRAAWDSGSLKTLTKNSPMKATGAHISIIGHITREELRRLMSQTESANGFANRFCWLAVRRSKCLPEGGNIESVDFNNVITKLKSAIEFAKRPWQIHRSDAARELWREAYPALSEGKPGMLGSVTGRAEAQVLRLSALYALLDETSAILPAHHHAAMALWSYCEQSARWIFGTATGNKHADRILVALRQAGSAGMSRKEISEKVFQRNLASNALGEALRILQDAGLTNLTNLTNQQTGGAPGERWFAKDGATNLTN
jgi:hypothetical protein